MEISPDLGRVILIRSAGSRRGTSSAERMQREKRRDKSEKTRERGGGLALVSPRDPLLRWGVAVEIRGPTLLIYRYLGHMHAHGRCFLSWITTAMPRHTGSHRCLPFRENGINNCLAGRGRNGLPGTGEDGWSIFVYSGCLLPYGFTDRGHSAGWKDFGWD